MTAFTSILVDVDATAPVHPALDRAVRLARACGARLTITDVVTVPSDARSYLPVEVEEEMIEQRRAALESLAQTVPGEPATATLLVGRPGTALIREVLRSGHDLLVRSHARDLVAPPDTSPFGVVAMELLRQCPCPVFLVRHGTVEQHPRILGAVNAAAEDAVEQALNRRIVELTMQLARWEAGVPMLLSAWEPVGEGLVRTHASPDASAVYLEQARQLAAENLDRLVASFGAPLADVPRLSRRGRPETVITETVVAEGIDVVVMGTVARSGVAGVLIGNTAERVLRTLPCSVLAVKPEGFVSPVRLDS